MYLINKLYKSHKFYVRFISDFNLELISEIKYDKIPICL